MRYESGDQVVCSMRKLEVKCFILQSLYVKSAILTISTQKGVSWKIVWNSMYWKFALESCLEISLMMYDFPPTTFARVGREIRGLLHK